MTRTFVKSLLPVVLLMFYTGALYAASISVQGKHPRPDGSFYSFEVIDGDVLSPGDQFQIIIDATKRTYYAIIYISRDGEAVQIFPPAGQQGRIAAGQKRIVPDQENYFTLDNNGGRELMFIVTGGNPLGNVDSILKRTGELENSSSSIQVYLDKRLPSVQKLEVTNTGKRIIGLTDQIASGLVRDLSQAYAANPWPAQAVEEQAEVRRRSSSDGLIPEEVRRRAAEVRSSLKPLPQVSDSSSLRTIQSIEGSRKRQEQERREAERLAQAALEAERAAQAAHQAEVAKAEHEKAEALKQEAERLELVRQQQEQERREAERLAQAALEAERAAQAAHQAAVAKAEHEKAEALKQEAERLELVRQQQEQERREAERLAQAALEAEHAAQAAHQAAVAKAEREEAEALKQEAERLELARQEQERQPDPRLVGEGDLLSSTVSEPGSDQLPGESTIDNTQVAAPREAVVALQAETGVKPEKNTASVSQNALDSAPPVTGEALRSIYAQVASGIVAIRTDRDQYAAGFILNEQGHILTAWNVIEGASEINVEFIAVSGSPRTYRAQVIKQDKFRDLALLELTDAPTGMQPVNMLSGNLPDAGTKVRVFGHYNGQVWATDKAVITRIAKNFTWFSANNVIHRGEILQIDLPESGKGIGALVTDMNYQMLGVRSFSGRETGRTYAVSVQTIRDFLSAQLGN